MIDKAAASAITPHLAPSEKLVWAAPGAEDDISRHHLWQLGWFLAWVTAFTALLLGGLVFETRPERRPFPIGSFENIAVIAGLIAIYVFTARAVIQRIALRRAQAATTAYALTDSRLIILATAPEAHLTSLAPDDVSVIKFNGTTITLTPPRSPGQAYANAIRWPTPDPEPRLFTQENPATILPLLSKTLDAPAL